MTVVTQEAPSSSSQLISSLPQYGFGSEYTFESLVQDNPFLFRVYTPKPRSPFFDNSEPFFVGQKVDDVSPDLVDQIAACSTYEDVARHMDWTTRSSSPYISTSFSFVWAIWEAVRRYRTNVKHDIEIAIIDARAVSGRAVTALELLRKGTPQERHRDYWKWYRFAQEAQDVLVHGSIPGTAVFASIPIFSIIDRLPSYLLNPDVSDIEKMPFDRLAWDYTERKPSYRQFCQDMSTRFLRLSAEHRLRDTTAGSLRLAIVFLRPWFHNMVHEDFSLATSKLRELTFVIAQWPGQWWVRDHVEIWELIQLMAQTVGEEIREKRKYEAVEEVKTLQGIVGDLEGLVRQYEGQIAARRVKRFSWSSKAFYPSNIPKRISHRRSDTDTTLVELLDPQVPESAPTAAQIPSPSPRPHSMVETVSCLCTGLLFGAFITMCIMNSQRRTLIMNLT